MKKLLIFTIILLTSIASMTVKSQSFLSTTSIECTWNDTTKTQDNCKTYINPMSITFYDNTVYLTNLNEDKTLSYKCHYYNTINDSPSYILETIDYVLVFTFAEEFILCTVSNKKQNKTYLNYYFID